MFDLTYFNEVGMGIRIFFFIFVLIIMMFLEFIIPRRKLLFPRIKRWISNLSIVVLNSLLLRLLFPIVAVGAATIAEKNNIGLLNNIGIYYFVKIIVSIVILDFVIYLQHVMFHVVPLFWRVHRMHHADLDFDVTTGLRFHPIEILMSMLIKITVVFALGAPPVSVIIFEILLNATSMFNHGNIFIPIRIDRYLRLFLVTPDMHRVHHSIIRQETDSNYGFNLPWWDRICGTYKNQPEDGHIDMKIGLDKFRSETYMNLLGLLKIPFSKE